MQRRVGEQVGPFRLERFLGEGGAGQVYYARRTDDGGVRALKILADHAPQVVDRFVRADMATPRHPRIRAVVGYGTAPDGTRWLEMEYLDGESLRELLRRRTLTWAEAVSIGVQVCEALEAAHQARVVHRDIKPENLFLEAGSPERVRVFDFSIALLQTEQRLTETGTLLGTYQYMSPEQVRGDPALDARSDLWSLGAVLYECVTGRLPFACPSVPALVYNVSFGAPEPLAKLRADVPPRFAEAIHRALRKSPDERFQSARAFLDALKGAVTRIGEDSSVDHGPPSDRPFGERELLSLCFLKGVHDLAAVRALAAEFGGELVPFGERKSIARFGGEVIHGDEPERAVRFGAAALGYAVGGAVATGWSTTFERLEGSLLASRAELLAADDGIVIDPLTTSAVRDRVDLLEKTAGGAIVAREEPRQRRERRLERPPRVADFVGRDDLMGELLAAAEAVPSTGARAVVVHGEAGLGKSRLLQEAQFRALGQQPTATLFAYRATSYRRGIPFAAWLELFAGEPVCARVEALLREPAIDPGLLVDRVAAEVEQHLRALAERGPVVVAVDDAHWLDGPSEKVVTRLFEGASDLPLCVWMFSREKSTPDPRGLPTDAPRLSLRPLKPDQSRAMLQSLLGRVPEALLDRANGNPLLLREFALLHAQGEDAPAASGGVDVTDLVFNARLRRLKAPQREFLMRAAVFGRVAWVEAVQSLGGDPAAWGRLLSERVLQRSQGASIRGAQEFMFESSLMADSAYKLWEPAARAGLHASAARWLDAHSDSSPVERGRHWEAAGERGRAAEAYARGAEVSARAGDTRQTLELAGRVVALSTDPELRWRALTAQDAVLQLDPQAARRDLQEVGLDLIRRLSLDLDLRHSVEAAWRQCYFHRIVGNRDLTVAFGEEGIALAPALEAAEERRWGALLHCELALFYSDSGAFERALEHAGRANAYASQLDDPWGLARTRATEGYAVNELDRLEEALALFDAAAAGYGVAGDRRREAGAHMNGGVTLMRLGRFDEALHRFEEAASLARKMGNRRTATVAELNRCTLRRIRGERDGLDAVLDQVERVASELRFSRLVAAARLERAWLALAARLPLAALEGSTRAARDAVEAPPHSPALIAQSLTQRLLAAGHAGGRPAALEQEARRFVHESAPFSEGGAALATALYLTGAEPADAALASARVRAFLDRASHEGGRMLCARSFALRHELPFDRVAALLAAS